MQFMLSMRNNVHTRLTSMTSMQQENSWMAVRRNIVCSSKRSWGRGACVRFVTGRVAVTDVNGKGLRNFSLDGSTLVSQHRKLCNAHVS